MTLSRLLPVLRHPLAVALRLLLWPVLILGLADLVARTEDDGLAAGLLAFAVMVTVSFLLPIADGLVLRARPLVLVWSITTVVVVGWMVAEPLVDALGGGPGATTWDYAVHTTLEDLPSSAVFFLVLIGVPVAVGAVVGSALRRAFTPRRGQASQTPVGAP